MLSRSGCWCVQASRWWRSASYHSRPHVPRRLYTQLRHRTTGDVTNHLTIGQRLHSLTKPVLFTSLVCVTSFSGAIVWQYESLRDYYSKSQQPDAVDHDYYTKAGSFRHQMNVWWNNMSPARKLAAQLVAANMAVFLLWRLRPLENFMCKFFLSSPFSDAPCRSMLLSTFSHRSTIHLAMNMFVLWNFSEPIAMHWGREQFLGFYISAGVVASLLSYARNVARVSMVPSLGASGAIMGLIGAVCCQFPDARLSILLVDQIFPHSFSADSAMKGLILFEVAGILLGFGRLDHAAHLGGLLFGIWYQKYGQTLVWKQYREPLMKSWHEWRGKP